MNTAGRRSVSLMVCSMLRWYLLHTKPSREALAREHLERQSFEVYFPRLRQSVRYGGRWRDRITPLFPRYLFLHLDEGRQSLSPVHSTIGVASVVRFGDRYAGVADRVIRELRTRADPESGLHYLAPRLFAQGARVRITAGAFSGVEGIFLCREGAERVIVLLNLLGRDAPVRVPFGFIQPSFEA